VGDWGWLIGSAAGALVYVAANRVGGVTSMAAAKA
jgi:hypothetical protein